MRKLAWLVLLALFAALPVSARAPFSYVWVHNDRQSISMAGLDIEEGIALRDRHGANFLWFRLRGSGRAYLLRDPATLARLDELWEPMHLSDPQYDQLRKRMRPLEKRQTALEREHDQLEDQEDRADKARLRDLERQLDDIERELRVLEAEEERLDKKRDALEAEAERQMLPILEDAVRKGIATASGSAR